LIKISDEQTDSILMLCSKKCNITVTRQCGNQQSKCVKGRPGSPPREKPIKSDQFAWKVALCLRQRIIEALVWRKKQAQLEQEQELSNNQWTKTRNITLTFSLIH